MDNRTQQQSKGAWSWVAEAMPLLPARIRELRRQFGDEHVNLCWRRGVVEGKPDWFFARQGVVTIGAPFLDSGDPDLLAFAAQHVGSKQCLVLVRPPGAPDGTH